MIRDKPIKIWIISKSGLDPLEIEASSFDEAIRKAREINKEYNTGDNNMKINLFGKKRTTRDGKKTFITYFSTLTEKDGTEMKVNVKFREDAGQPEQLPCVIEFEKQDANLSDETYEKEVDGVKVTESKKVLWVNKFIEHEYIDKSLDDFE